MQVRRRNDGQATGSGQRVAERQPLIFCLLALPFLIAVYMLVAVVWARPASPGDELRLDQFLSAIEQRQVSNATILPDDDRIVGAYSGGTYWVDFAGGHETLFARLTGALEQAKVPTTVRRQAHKSLIDPLSVLVPALILLDGLIIIVLLTRGGSLGGFSRARARRAAHDDETITFADLAGVDEAVEELSEVKDFLVSPERYAAIGATVPKGVLLDGPPGCGKTRLARALAGASNVPFFSISGSDFVELYVGVGAARIRDLFSTAKAAAPAIVFIDEIDAVGRARTAGIGGQDERESALNQLLVEMDGFDARSGVVVVAATNRADILDPALLRPGRFDRRITVDPPDLRGREGILNVHAQGKPLDETVDLSAVAKRTAGLSGAELANVVNEAALLATRDGREAIGAEDLSEAVERVVAGLQRRSRVLTTSDRRRIAFHEAGHAVAAAALPGAGSVTKVSIVARRGHGGVTWYEPEDDRVLATRGELEDRITALLAGREAEVLTFGEPSTGANDDLRRAAALARAMVWECGMGERLRPASLAGSSADPVADLPGASEQLRAELDGEAEAILAVAQDRAHRILRANRAVVNALADALATEESLEAEALATLLGRVHTIPMGTDSPTTNRVPVHAVPA
ncbi:MAG: ATP-dependent zinc metalloprotease FtsH [Actinomycetota bacterium]|nr:ATP-dependent zinc metalloprotease FtsH [Actinomycetota bacterium]